MSDFEPRKLSPADEAGREKVFQWLKDTFIICTEDCPRVDLQDYGDDVRMVFASGGTAVETLEWRALSWSELAQLIEENPEGIDYDEDC